MGVPALFRWLSGKYPKIVSPVIEGRPARIPDSNVEVPVDISRPNPNKEEFDNLYLDMNAIVHPCVHPEDRPPPETVDEMMLAIFKYTERLVNMVRPRKILMFAVDGVAPRAKMNQQRSRRFRAAQEAREKDEAQAEVIKKMEATGKTIDQAIKNHRVFDTNLITPGTPFMDKLAASLRYWTTYKLNMDPAWKDIKVIISDSTVPGEGEHKIMDFIRSQRSSPDHDPNTRHVMYGLDADLIMLGLATHEAHYRVLREDVFQQANGRGCRICGQEGHKAAECQGVLRAKVGEFGEKQKVPEDKPFIWLHVEILREYLDAELKVPDLPFRFDLERAIDDWVFMCFFVGNDFLPHIPSLEIRENGIDVLITIWKENIAVMKGYLTTDGTANLDRVQILMDGLSLKEDEIFRKRHIQDERQEARRSQGDQGKRQRLEEEERNAAELRSSKKAKVEQPANIPLIKPGDAIDPNQNKQLVQNRKEIRMGTSDANKSAAQALKAEMMRNATTDNAPTSALDLKRKAEDSEAQEDEEKTDSVRLWEPGFKTRYYSQKFHVSEENVEFRRSVMTAYVQGLCWVLQYYSQGVPSWTWYYPYHYAPFASDFQEISALDIKFEKGTPFRPFDQLMGVLPASSNSCLPAKLQKLMTSEDSEIIDFYPLSFPIDLNGKKFAWQGVALLPFIDEGRLLGAIEKVLPNLSEEEIERNSMGYNYMLFSESHSLYDDLTRALYGKRAAEHETLDPNKSGALIGVVARDPKYFPSSTVNYPLNQGTSTYGDIEIDRSLSVRYDLPKSQYVHKSMLLRGVKHKPQTLNFTDIQNVQNGRGRGRGGPPRHDQDRNQSFSNGQGRGHGRHEQNTRQPPFNNYDRRPPANNHGAYPQPPPPPHSGAPQSAYSWQNPTPAPWSNANERIPPAPPTQNGYQHPQYAPWRR